MGQVTGLDLQALEERVDVGALDRDHPAELVGRQLAGVEDFVQEAVVIPSSFASAGTPIQSSLLVTPGA